MGVECLHNQPFSTHPCSKFPSVKVQRDLWKVLLLARPPHRHLPASPPSVTNTIQHYYTMSSTTKYAIFYT